MTKKRLKVTRRKAKAQTEESSVILEIKKTETKGQRPTIRKQIKETVIKKTTKRMERKNRGTRKAIRNQETKKVIIRRKLGRTTLINVCRQERRRQKAHR